ncbi:MAG: hypothetical protein K2V38_20075, partial [Gemmataceae bacterium]|nr:hypothetical protein [Gemmataceae bacterium]
LPGPKADGAVTRAQFDTSGQFLTVITPTGATLAPRNGTSASPAKINGQFVAVAPELANERFRYAAVRGNTIAHRLLPTAFVANPPKAKGFAFPGVKDEVTPLGVTADPPRPANLTFLAWGPGARLFAGAPDGTITTWSAAMKPEPASREHKAAVRAWAHSAAGDLLTGDDKGQVALWPTKGGKPTADAVFTVPVAALAFAPSGAKFAAADNTGWLAVVESSTLKVLQRKKLPASVKALTFGPKDDVLLLGNGKTVEVWALAELMK